MSDGGRSQFSAAEITNSGRLVEEFHPGAEGLPYRVDGVDVAQETERN